MREKFNEIPNSEDVLELLESIDTKLVEEGIDEIASIGRGQKGRECYAFTGEEDRAFDVVRKRSETLATTAKEKGMDIKMETDAIGNLYVRLEGEKPDEPAVAFGSHIDSVKFGGNFDGVAGVEAGYRTIESFVESNQKPQKSIELIVFRSEESSPRTGYACLGSAIATGKILENELKNIPDKLSSEERQMIDVFEEKGLILERIYELIRNPKITPEKYSSFIELHVEQGAILDSKNLDAGIAVGAIGGNKRYDISVSPKNKEKTEQLNKYTVNEKISINISGRADHTGGTPMNKKENLKTESDEQNNMRRDATVTSSIILMAIDKVNKEFEDVKFSIISLKDTSESSYTKIPSLVELNILSQGNDENQIKKAKERMKSLVEKISKNRKTPAETREENLGKDELKKIKIIDKELVKFSKIIYEIQILAKRISSEIESANEGINKPSLVRATVGDLKLNSDELSFKLDIREANHTQGEELKDKIFEKIEELKSNSLSLNTKLTSEQLSASINKELESILREQAEYIGINTYNIPAVAGHDAKNVSKSGVPTAMIFIKSEAGGISHNKDEYTSEEVIKQGIKILLASVWKLANNLKDL